ncbi:MAG: DinB family protein [Acidimicrobiales bacterium]
MAEFRDADLNGARFDNVDLTGARFRRVDLSDANFGSVDFRRVVMRGVDLIDVEIHGEVRNLVINDVDVAPMIEAELDRRHPLRAKMRPEDADGFREAWRILDELWAETIERARRLTFAQLNERVNGEWSFIETIRHLSYATDAWVRRVILGDPSPWDRLDWPPDEFPDDEGFTRDYDIRPTLDKVLELRESRLATVRDVLADLTNDALDTRTIPVEAPGWPPSASFSIRECLRVVINEEWEHRRYVERDLDIVESH